MSTVMLGDNPTNEELVRAIRVMRGGGSVGTEMDSDGNSWAYTIHRYLNSDGPDPRDKFGVMRYERVETVAAQ